MIGEHNCGNCMYMLPNRNISQRNEVEKITSGKGKGKCAYWICGCKESKNYNKGRISIDGTRCTKFENRYENPWKVDGWIQHCYPKEDEKSNESKSSKRSKYRKRGLW